MECKVLHVYAYSEIQYTMYFCLQLLALYCIIMVIFNFWGQATIVSGHTVNRVIIFNNHLLPIDPQNGRNLRSFFGAFHRPAAASVKQVKVTLSNVH